MPRSAAWTLCDRICTLVDLDEHRSTRRCNAATRNYPTSFTNTTSQLSFIDLLIRYYQLLPHVRQVTGLLQLGLFYYQARLSLD
jgi:hypothetical protein